MCGPVTHEKLVQYMLDLAFKKKRKSDISVLGLVESHYENLPFITDVGEVLIINLN